MLPRLLAVPVMVALLSVAGCCPRCAPPCPCEVAQVGAAEPVDAAPVPTKESVVVGGVGNEAAKHYGVRITPTQVVFIVEIVPGKTWPPTAK